MGRAAPGGGISGVPAGSEGVVRTAVTDAGTKLVQSKLVLDLAASGLRQAGTDIGISTRPGAGGVQAGLTIAANQLIEASTLIAAAGAKMIAGGRAPAPSRSRVGTSSWGCDAAMGSTSAEIAGRVSYSSRSAQRAMSAELKIDGMFGPKTHLALNEFQRGIRVPETDVVDQVTADARDWAHRRPGRRGTGRGGAGVRRSAPRGCGSLHSSSGDLARPLDPGSRPAGESVPRRVRPVRGHERHADRAGGHELPDSSTREATEQGGISLSTAGTFHASAAQGVPRRCDPDPLRGWRPGSERRREPGAGGQYVRQRLEPGHRRGRRHRAAEVMTPAA